MTPLHTIGNFVRDAFLQVPLPLARTLFIALPALLLVWVLSLPKEAVACPNATAPPRWDENLKLWAAVALTIQVAIYCWLCGCTLADGRSGALGNEFFEPAPPATIMGPAVVIRARPR
jgi:hypothetical protein